MSRFLANIENGLLLRDAGLLEQEVLDQTADYMVVAVQSPGGGRWWRDTALAKPVVREYIDGRLSAGDAHLPAIQDAMPHIVPTPKPDSSVPK